MRELDEIEYLTQERLGILTDGRREPTAAEWSMASNEAIATVMRQADARRAKGLHGKAQSDSVKQ